MVRTQIQLTEQQNRQLKTLAHRKGISMAEVIRRAIDRALVDEIVADEDEIRERALSVGGMFHSGKHDIATRHDDYLAEAYLP